MNLKTKITTLFLCISSLAHSQQTWTNETGILQSTSPTPRAGTYAGGRFFLVGPSFVYHHSGTGISGWTRSNFTNADTFDSATSVAAGGDRVVVTGRFNVVFTTSNTDIAAFPGSAIQWTRLSPIVRSGQFPDFYRVPLSERKIRCRTGRG